MTGITRIASGKILNTASGQTPQLYIGLDASKPSPGVGDTYITTDTGKNYTCYVSGVWSLVYSPAIEKYSNHLGTIDNIMSTSVANGGTAITTGHTMALDSSGTVNGRASYINAILTMPTYHYDFNCIVTGLTKEHVNGNIAFVGIKTTGYVATPPIGAGFYWQPDGQWVCKTLNTALVTQSTNVTVTDDDLLTINGKGNKMMYFINGVLKATHNTADLTGELCYPEAYVLVSGAPGTGSQMTIDYISIEVMK